MSTSPTLQVVVTATGGVAAISSATATAATVKLQWFNVTEKTTPKGTKTIYTAVGKSFGTIDVLWNQAAGTYDFTGVTTTPPKGANELMLVTTINGTPQYTQVQLPGILV